ncbi:MAG: hypothetical protein K0U72_14120 [Gammaproteobacteria bacterium]|nr:hypothetical protein [Gammaproteobacteria bacterium]
MFFDLRALAPCIVLFLSAMTLADSTEPVDATVAFDQGEDLAFVDEIIVVEKKSIGQLRIALNRADDRVFALYNERNTNDSLDMICKKETRIGSQIKYRVCKSSLHRQTESEIASDALEGAEVSTAGVPAGHYGKVRANMAKLMSEHPELAKAVLRRAELRLAIAEQKSKK